MRQIDSMCGFNVRRGKKGSERHKLLRPYSCSDTRMGVLNPDDQESRHALLNCPSRIPVVMFAMHLPLILLIQEDDF